MTSLRGCPCLPSFPKYVPNPCILGTRPVLPWLLLWAEVVRSKERVSLMVQLQFVCRWLLRGGTLIPVILIAVVPTVFGEIRVLRISYSSICFPSATHMACTFLFSNRWSFHACNSDSDPLDHCGGIEVLWLFRFTIEEHACASQCWVQYSGTDGVWETDHHRTWDV